MGAAMNASIRFSLILLVGWAAACGGDSPTSPTPTAPGGLMPRLSSIQTVIFNASCIEHHGDHATEADLDLTAGNAYANLVNVASVQVALNRVTPGDAENSYLIHKLDGRSGIVGLDRHRRGDAPAGHARPERRAAGERRGSLASGLRERTGPLPPHRGRQLRRRHAGDFRDPAASGA